MNFPGPFNSDLVSATAVSLESEHFTFVPQPKVGSGQSRADGVVIPDKHLLFCGDYARDGNDLILSDANQKYVVHDYFKGEKRPALISEDGAMLSGHIVSSLTGYVQYAQAAAPDAAQIVGHVMKLTGSASVVRNGVAVELHIGDAVQKGDVIQTGSDSTVAMTLIDGSAFGMTSNARMVLNEMVYDPNGSSNSSFISLVQGTVTFVAGQTAKNGNMRVETPVATMGIRGTAVLVKIYSDTGVVETSLGVEPDGHVGGYAFYDNVTGALLGTVTQAGRVTIISPGGVGQPATASEQPLTPQAIQADKLLFGQVFQLYFPNFNPDDSKPKSTDHPRTDIGIPPNILGKIGSDPDTGRATITYTIPVTNPDTHITSNIVIVYVNTPPSFSVTNEYDVQAIVSGSHSFKLGDQVVITDPDINAAPFFDVAVPYIANSGALANATGPSTIAFGSYLYNTNLVSFDPATGLVTYNPDGFRFLAQGETAVYKFTFTASSGVGSTGSDSAGLTLLLTISGQNDAPVIVAGSTTAAKGVIEDAGVDASHNIKTTGTVTFQDFDLTDAHTASFVPTSTSINTPHPDFVADTTSLGTFSILPVAENLTDTNDTGAVVWNFVLDNNSTILQSLAEGQTITQTYTITIMDSHGVTVDQVVTVTITGTNDQPVLNADTTAPHITDEALNTTGAGPLVVDTVSGSLTFADVDLIDTHTVAAALDPGALSVVWSDGLLSDIPQATLNALASAMTATVPTDSTNTGAGSVDWTFKLADHLTDFLAHGETLTVVYDITVTDNSATATGTSVLQQVTVQIAAANDQPVITVYDTGTTVTEDLSPSIGNLLTDFGPVTFTDVDLSDTHTIQASFNNDAVASGASGVSGALATALQNALTVPPGLAAGVHTFNWDFALDNSLVQYLSEGETITATYTIGVTDSSNASDAAAQTQTVTVVITGTNDLPTINVTNPAADTEGNTGTASPVTLTVADHVAITDVDTDDAPTFYAVNTLAFLSSTGPAPVSGTLASLFTVNAANGTVAYDKAAFDYLAGGDVVTATFTFNASSGPDTVQKSITVTIDGVNDAPVIDAATLVAVDEDTPDPAGATIATLFTSKFHDVDAGSSLQGIAITGYTVDSAKGVWEYNDNNGSGWLDIGIVSVSASLALVLHATSSLRFLPAHDFNGPAPSLTAYGIDDTFTGSFTAASTFQVQNLSAPTSVGGITPFSASTTTIDTSIVAVNDAPVASPATLTAGSENTAYVIDTSALLSHVTDVDGPVVNITAIGVASGGGSVANVAGVWTYTPASNYSGQVVFNYTASDGSLSASSTASLDLAPVADVPSLAVGALTPVSVADEFLVNNTTVNAQDHSTITTLADGKFVVTWQSNLQDGSETGIYARVFTASGAPIGNEFLVNTYIDQKQGFPSVAALTVGGFVIAWNSGDQGSGSSEDGSERGVYAQRYDANGNQLGTEFLVNSVTTNDQNYASVVGLSNGRFVIAFQTSINSDDVLAQIYEPDGTVVGGNFQLNLMTTNTQGHVSLTALANGGFVASWQSYNQDSANTYGVYAQLFNNSGAMVGTEFKVNSTVVGDQLYSSGAGLADGSFVITWSSDGQDGSGFGIYGQKYDASGVATGGQFHVNATVSNDQLGSSASALPDGGFIVTWTSFGQDVAGTNGVYAQRFDAAGNAVGDEFLVNQTTAGNQTTWDGAGAPGGQVAVLPSGQIVTTWWSDQSGTQDIYARLFHVPGIGAENSAIALPAITAAALGGDTDGSEVLSLHLTGFPAGATFSLGSLVGSEWVIPQSAIASLATSPLKVTPPHDYTGTFALHIDAVATDTAVLSTGTVTDTAHSTAYDIAVLVTANNAPELIATGISVQEVGPSSPDYGSITKVLDLSLSDSDEGAANSTISAVAGHGTVTYWDGSADTSLASGVSTTVTDINAILHAGVTYTPTTAPSTGGVGDTLANTDKVTVTVTDSHGASDTINFIFQQSGPPNAPDATQLTGTVGKDLLFATEHDDSLTGLSGNDNFVFASTTGQHTVTDFTQGQDHIDLHLMTGAPTATGFNAWLSANAEQSTTHPADTIIYLDAGHSAQNEIVLQNVTRTNLTANDFILHPGMGA